MHSYVSKRSVLLELLNLILIDIEKERERDLILQIEQQAEEGFSRLCNVNWFSSDLRLTLDSLIDIKRVDYDGHSNRWTHWSVKTSFFLRSREQVELAALFLSIFFVLTVPKI